MDRREFFIWTARGGSVLLVLPAGWAAQGCGDTSGGGPTAGAGGAPNGLRFTSDTTGGHTHAFTIAEVDFSSPPRAGVAGETTVTLGHSHMIALTADELAEIQGGLAVSKPTSIVDGHQHVFKFSLSTAQSVDASPADPGAGDAAA